MIPKSHRLHLVVIHPLFSMALPSLFILCLHALLAGAFDLAAVLPPPLILLAPGACLLEAVAGNAARKERAALHWRAREIALYLLALSALFIVLGVRLAYLAVLAPAALVSWALSFWLHEALRSREELLRYTDGKAGASLAAAMHQALLVEGEAMQKLQLVRRAARLLHGSLALLAGVLALAGLRLSVWAAALLVAQAVGTHVAVATLGAFAEEQRLLGWNLRATPELRSARFAHGLLLLAVSLVLALCLARATPLVSWERVAKLLEQAFSAVWRRRPLLGPGIWLALERLLAWLARLFPSIPLGGLDLPLPEAAEPSSEARRFIFALAMTIVALGVGLVLAFLFLPLTESEFQHGLSRKRPLAFLRHRLRFLARIATAAARGVLEAMASLLRVSRETARLSLHRSPASLAPGPASARGRAGIGARRGAAERRRLRATRSRALREFGTLTAWTARHGLPYLPHLGPLEFARAAMHRFPGRGGIDGAAECLERILYAAGPPRPADLAELAREVRSFLRGR